MIGWRILLLLPCLSLALWPATAAGQPRGPAKAPFVSVAVPGKSVGYMAIYTAYHKGYFNQEGLNLKFVYMKSELGMKALVNGQVDYTAAAGSTIRAAAQGVPVKVIILTLKTGVYFLISRPEIRTVKELKGKAIGTSDLGGTLSFAAKKIAAAHGLDPERDITLVPLGPPATRLAALVAGSVDGIMAEPPSHILAVQRGFRELFYAGDIFEEPSNGLGVTDKRLRERPDEIRGILRAILRGLNFVLDNRQETVDIVMKEWQLDRVVASSSYDAVVRAMSRDASVSEQGIRFVIEQVQRGLKMAEPIPTSRVIDFSLLEEVRKRFK